MDFSLCEICRKPLSGGDLCPSCLLLRQEIQRYADEHRDAGVGELSKKFDVSSKILKKWVRNGTISCMLECRNCGHLIRSGTLCVQCREELASGFKYGDRDVKYTGRMHGRNRKG